MNIGEQIFEALTDVGTDLVDMAEHQRFARSPWRTVLSAAACLGILLGMGAAVRYYLPALTVRAPSVPEQPEQIETHETPEKPESDSRETQTRADWEPEPLAFYVYDPDPSGDDGPSKAIDAEGNVLLEVESGRIEPLIDRATGETIGIRVYHLPEGGTIEAAYLDEYTLDGAPTYTHLMAYEHHVLGNVELFNSYTDGEFVASLYDRAAEKWLRGDLRTGYVIGDCVYVVPMIGYEGQTQLYDRNGKLTVIDQILDNNLVWDGRAYFNVQNEDGLQGLLDSKGKAVVPYSYTELNGIYNGYVVYGDGTGYSAADLDTGEVVFQWPHAILNVWDGYALVSGGAEVLFFVDWSGRTIYESTGIEVIDDNNDHVPERILTADGSCYGFWNTDGTLMTEFVLDGTVTAITSRTAAIWEGSGEGAKAHLLNVETGKTIELAKQYDDVYPFLIDEQATGLFYAVYDGGTDLLREDGTVVLEHIRDRYETQQDVFFCTEGGLQGLKRLDGSWLYQEPIG